MGPLARARRGRRPAGPAGLARAVRAARAAQDEDEALRILGLVEGLSDDEARALGGAAAD